MANVPISSLEMIFGTDIPVNASSASFFPFYIIIIIVIIVIIFLLDATLSPQ